MQLIFDFSTSPDVSAASYLPLASHQDALQQLQQLKDKSSFRGARIIGEKGSGKTHLLKAWAAVTGALYDTGETLDELPQQNNAVAIDGIDDLTPSQQESLFHLYNHLQKQNGLLVTTGEKPITPDTPMLPDLRTRLLTLPQVEITPPTDADLTQLLVKWAQDQNLTLKPDVVKYILARAERSPNK
ncbi:MAG: DnaA/Hda family protein, partial [Alphaproteobacteria bacterium]|nr:DnaA/Hda family protein [Alphaproteobacteria bacterium]